MAAPKALTAHYFLAFGVNVQVLGDSKNGKVEPRVLHLDVSAGALQLVYKGNVRVFLRFDALNQIVYDEAEPCAVLLSCRDGRKYFVGFQSAEDNLVFRTACTELVNGTLDMNRFQRGVLKKGTLYKQGVAGTLFGERYAILTPRKLFLLSTRVSVFASHVISLVDVAPRFDEIKGAIYLEVCGKELILKGSDKLDCQEWFVAIASGATSRVPILQYSTTDAADQLQLQECMVQGPHTPGTPQQQQALPFIVPGSVQASHSHLAGFFAVEDDEESVDHHVEPSVAGEDVGMPTYQAGTMPMFSFAGQATPRHGSSAGCLFDPSYRAGSLPGGPYSASGGERYSNSGSGSRIPTAGISSGGAIGFVPVATAAAAWSPTRAASSSGGSERSGILPRSGSPSSSVGFITVPSRSGAGRVGSSSGGSPVSTAGGGSWSGDAGKHQAAAAASYACFAPEVQDAPVLGVGNLQTILEAEESGLSGSIGETAAPDLPVMAASGNGTLVAQQRRAPPPPPAGAGQLPLRSGSGSVAAAEAAAARQRGSRLAASSSSGGAGRREQLSNNGSSPISKVPRRQPMKQGVKLPGWAMVGGSQSLGASMTQDSWEQYSSSAEQASQRLQTNSRHGSPVSEPVSEDARAASETPEAWQEEGTTKWQGNRFQNQNDAEQLREFASPVDEEEWGSQQQQHTYGQPRPHKGKMGQHGRVAAASPDEGYMSELQHMEQVVSYLVDQRLQQQLTATPAATRADYGEEIASPAVAGASQSGRRQPWPRQEQYRHARSANWQQQQQKEAKEEQDQDWDAQQQCVDDDEQEEYDFHRSAHTWSTTSAAGTFHQRSRPHTSSPCGRSCSLERVAGSTTSRHQATQKPQCPGSGSGGLRGRPATAPAGRSRAGSSPGGGTTRGRHAGDSPPHYSSHSPPAHAKAAPASGCGDCSCQSCCAAVSAHGCMAAGQAGVFDQEFDQEFDQVGLCTRPTRPQYLQMSAEGASTGLAAARGFRPGTAGTARGAGASSHGAATSAAGETDTPSGQGRSWARASMANLYRSTTGGGSAHGPASSAGATTLDTAALQQLQQSVLNSNSVYMIPSVVKSIVNSPEGRSLADKLLEQPGMTAHQKTLALLLWVLEVYRKLPEDILQPCPVEANIRPRAALGSPSEAASQVASQLQRHQLQQLQQLAQQQQQQLQQLLQAQVQIQRGAQSVGGSGSPLWTSQQGMPGAPWASASLPGGTSYAPYQQQQVPEVQEVHRHDHGVFSAHGQAGPQMQSAEQQHGARGFSSAGTTYLPTRPMGQQQQAPPAAPTAPLQGSFFGGGPASWQQYNVLPTTWSTGLQGSSQPVAAAGPAANWQRAQWDPAQLTKPQQHQPQNATAGPWLASDSSPGHTHLTNSPVNGQALSVPGSSVHPTHSQSGAVQASCILAEYQADLGHLIPGVGLTVRVRQPVTQAATLAPAGSLPQQAGQGAGGGTMYQQLHENPLYSEESDCILQQPGLGSEGYVRHLDVAAATRSARRTSYTPYLSKDVADVICQAAATAAQGAALAVSQAVTSLQDR